MKCRSINKKEWLDFCNIFSKEYENMLVSLETSNGENETIAHDMVLKGVIPDLNISTQRISIILDRPEEGHITHIISSPVKIQMEETEDGMHSKLGITSEDGKKTNIKFNH